MFNSTDRTVIMGSSNLNDRSQCGDRDSEIAMVVQDQDMIPSKMNGNDVCIFNSDTFISPDSLVCFNTI